MGWQLFLCLFECVLYLHTKGLGTGRQGKLAFGQLHGRGVGGRVSDSDGGPDGLQPLQRVGQGPVTEDDGGQAGADRPGVVFQTAGKLACGQVQTLGKGVEVQQLYMEHAL